MHRKRCHTGEESTRKSKRVRFETSTPATTSTTTRPRAPANPRSLSLEQHHWLEYNIPLDRSTEHSLLLVMAGFRERFNIPVTHAGVCNKYYSMLLTTAFEETPRHQVPLARDHHFRQRSLRTFGDDVIVPGDHEMEEAYLLEGFPAPGEACFNKAPTRRMHPIHPRYTYITGILMDNDYTWREVMWLFGVEADEAVIEIDGRAWTINTANFWARRTVIA